ncbi:Rieske 2Fe-2S domain-containing protein [Methanoculleus chikugoensis]|uniref:Rieske 2Fe-2S domain-containing protein n=1 Tax=Methanoculleus chikugoensis TaxID=118126 RepID=UPI001FB2FB16|nr:Rieske 2Fe-2S domain-containing protein [Methanoculleus chikugoensis]
MILTDLIRGRTNPPWAEVFDPSGSGERPEFPDRVQKRLEAAGGGAIEVGAAGFDREVAAIPPGGEGKVVEAGGQNVAVFRDERGGIRTLDPTCMHMGCTVAWNNAEKSWDCPPCHGSRYAADGG